MTNDGVAVDIGPVVRKDILGYFHPVAAESPVTILALGERDRGDARDVAPRAAA